MKRLTVIGMLILAFACGRRSYRFSSAFEQGIPQGVESIYLDTTYCLFRREVFKEQNPVTAEFIVKENKVLADEPGKLIEVEYLLISNDHNNAIYITTIPDRRQVYYEKNKLGEDTVNIQDFNTFHFGKITETRNEIQFLFPDKHRSNTWELYQEVDNSKTLSLKRLIFKVDDFYHSETRADQSLTDTVEFQQVGKFTLVLSKPLKRKEVRKVFQSRDKIIYVKEKRSGYQLFFRFNEPISKRDSTVLFGGKLVRHTPIPLLGN